MLSITSYISALVICSTMVTRKVLVNADSFDSPGGLAPHACKGGASGAAGHAGAQRAAGGGSAGVPGHRPVPGPDGRGAAAGFQRAGRLNNCHQ